MTQNVFDLPDTLSDRIGATPVLVFDGVCVLCSGMFRWVVKHDRRSQIHFATAQSGFGQDLFEALDLPITDLETFIFIADGQIYQKSAAAAALFQTIGVPWSILSLARFAPRFLRDAIYDIVAKNRYRWFGRREICMLAPRDVAARFL